MARPPHPLYADPVIDGQPILADGPGRCYCRPACLARIQSGDPIVHTTAGFILLEHLEAVA